MQNKTSQVQLGLVALDGASGELKIVPVGHRLALDAGVPVVRYDGEEIVPRAEDPHDLLDVDTVYADERKVPDPADVETDTTVVFRDTSHRDGEGGDSETTYRMYVSHPVGSNHDPQWEIDVLWPSGRWKRFTSVNAYQLKMRCVETNDDGEPTYHMVRGLVSPLGYGSMSLETSVEVARQAAPKTRWVVGSAEHVRVHDIDNDLWMLRVAEIRVAELYRSYSRPERAAAYQRAVRHTQEIRERLAGHGLDDERVNLAAELQETGMSGLELAAAVAAIAE